MSHYQQPRYHDRKARIETSHTFHLIMSIITGGVWAVLVWPWVWMFNTSRNAARHQ